MATQEQKSGWCNPSEVFERIESRQERRRINPNLVLDRGPYVPGSHSGEKTKAKSRSSGPPNPIKNSFLQISTCTPLENLVLALTVLERDADEISEILKQPSSLVLDAFSSGIQKLGIKTSEDQFELIEDILKAEEHDAKTQGLI